jgi:C-terminal processing protease CtpA/Prc
MRKTCTSLLLAAALLGSASFAQSPSPPAPPAGSISPAARAYLDRAIALFREDHINSLKMDWPALTQRAYAAAAAAKTTADTYPAIWLIIHELGEKHTTFIDPDHARALSTGKTSGKATPPPLLLPEVMRLANGIGVIRLYGFIGSLERAKLYTQTARRKIADLKTRGICRFVLDLRANGGGNMYPMLGGLSGLLEPGVLGIFENPEGQYSPWVLKKNGVVEELDYRKTRPHGTVDQAAPPVAVLIGPETASSGEFTAMAFEGRANTRFFGAPSAGYVTANEMTPLSDDAVIVMTTAWGLDRTGKKYVDRIEPDENTGAGGAAFDRAVKWLSGQRCPARFRPRR